MESGLRCFSSLLLVGFWVVCARSARNTKLADTPYFHRDWMPKGFSIKRFQEEGWRWDTEVIGGAVFFYYFALQYFSIHGLD